MKKKNLQINIEDSISVSDDQKIPIKVFSDHAMFIPEDCNLVANIKQPDPASRQLLVRIPPRNVVKIECGIKVAPPSGWILEVVPKSGELSNKGLQIVDAPYVINADEIVSVTFINNGKEILTINHGDKVAKLRISPKYSCEFVV